MKKIYAILTAAAALVVTAASCNKIETENQEKQDIKIHVSVSDLSLTKAVKTGWTNGDKINIWFDGVSTQTPHLIITYNGTKWVSGTIDPTAKAALKTDGTGTFKYIYEGGNDISAYPFYFGNEYEFPYGTIGSKDFYSPVLLLSSPDTDPNYAYDGADLTLNLKDWCYITNAQVVITGLSGNPKDWYLSVETQPSWDWQSIQDFRNETGVAGFTYGASGSTTKASRGTSNNDGVAFYFRIGYASIYNAAISSSLSDHKFVLGNATNKYGYSKTYTPIASAYATANPEATNKDKLDHTFTAIKIAFSKFSAE